MNDKFVFGVDVGGTTIKMGLFSVTEGIADKWEIFTDITDGGKNILNDISKSVSGELIKFGIPREDILGMGIGIPGPVTEGGMVMCCVNLGWGEKNIEKELGKLTGFKVKCGNDANVAALGEIWQGGGMGCKNMVMITIGTGVGGGIILNRKIVNGSHGAGGEIGHLPVNPYETDYCSCGNKGCLEQYCSATGIVRLAEKLLKSQNPPSLMNNRKPLTAKTVFDCAKAGDAAAIQIVEQFGDYMGRALAMISAMADPQLFLFGGGVSRAGAILIDTVQKYYKKYAFKAVKNTPFKLAKLGNDAGIYGGAMLIDANLGG